MELNNLIKWEDSSVVLHEKNEIPYLTFPILTNTKIVTHAFSTRLGGISKGIYSTMNLGFTNGDRTEDVTENYNRMARALSINLEKMVLCSQTHSTNVHQVTENDLTGNTNDNFKFINADGLITNLLGVTLVTTYADCVPIYYVDPIKKTIGLSHCGWKGTVNYMGAVTINAMKKAYGSKPEDIRVLIGPSICKDCYEVSEDVASEFNSAFKKEYHHKILQEKPDNKFQLDLWKANELILLNEGILPEHCEVSGICTYENSTQLFSHRVTKGKRGNLAAFLCLLE